jgi:superfamily II DNA helicase RecQ
MLVCTPESFLRASAALSWANRQQPFALVAIDEAATVITWEFRSSHGAHDEGGLMHAPWHSKLQRPRNS